MSFNAGKFNPSEWSAHVPSAPTDDRPEEVKAEMEFGKLTSQKWLATAKYDAKKSFKAPIADDPPYFVVIMTYLNYLVLILIGHIRDYFGMFFTPQHFTAMLSKNGYPPWYASFESFYPRRLKARMDDCFARPIHGVPGRYTACFNRISHDYNKHFLYDGTSTECLNLSSYNYLGFAQSVGKCTDDSVAAVEERGTSAGGPTDVSGHADLLRNTEKILAKFVGKDDSLIFSMGYGTNAHFFTSVLNSKCLVISDSLNHSSARFGIRLSGAAVKVFPHNDMVALERILRESISQGQAKTHRPWKKILICSEGLYSMEGEYCDLPALVSLKEKYHASLFIDEAHSIGALGEHGRGICEYFGISASRVDIMMGTLTKSFGAAGGYIAADQWIIDRLRVDFSTNCYGEAPPPAVLQQINTSLRIIDGQLNGDEGKERLQRIAFNSRYLRLGLKRLGFIVYGNDDAPVIPMLVYTPAKMPAASRMFLKYGVAVVIVGYPATPLISSRIRFCVSAALTKEDIDRILAISNIVGDKMCLKFGSGMAGGEKHPGDWKKGIHPRWSLEEVLAKTPEDCRKEMY
ncbi:DEKNAAC100321 [Brettanomyces naardenensis]|uniref:serine C-palmitoyltransferase n=1 Tax=Brettanomyces naardenensis TaxID=13370 RepID=A0A448YF23_BRENA|nr:DEKNAAC100321 [Brettanomyces naardenensis]